MNAREPTFPSKPPMPLEWHPAYRDKTWLLDWLHGEGPYATPEIRIPLRPALRVNMAEPDPAAPLPGPNVLTKHRVQAPAPYVGRPFVYAWIVGIDELGRGIASDSERVYVKDFIRGYM